MQKFTTTRLPAAYDTLAPDQSEIRLLAVMSHGSVCHCTLPPGATSLAVKHRQVEEVWYVIHGAGQVWRLQEGADEVVDATPGLCMTIPPGTHFQFRNTGTEPFMIIIVTMPAWPGAQEAIRVPDHWPTGDGAHPTSDQKTN